MTKKSLLTILLGFFAVFLSPTVANANQVDVFNNVCSGGGSTSTVCKEKESGKHDNPIYGPRGVLTKVINILSIVVGIGAVVGIMLAGLKFISSGSNPQKVTEARETVLYAVVALLVAALAQVLVRFILGKL